MFGLYPLGLWGERLGLTVMDRPAFLARLGRLLGAIGLVLGLMWSFWLSAGWLQLCAGLALFLFGMQCLEEGLRQLAGSRLEPWLKASTGTPVRSFLFGMGGTAVLQSSTLVSLLTIAFISTGLIQLSAGIAIILGTNLGASFGVWLLALAGQNFSLSPLALPLLVLGVLGSFGGLGLRGAGRFLLGIAFIFMGVDQIKGGFGGFGVPLNTWQAITHADWSGQLLCVGMGLVATLVLQSSHATIMLVLAALSTGQLALWQGLAVAVGANVGTSLSTAVVGMMAGNRQGQRLAVVHVLFNLGTALVVFLGLDQANACLMAIPRLLGVPANPLLQLAGFQTAFNLLGVALFWPWQSQLAQGLSRFWPEAEEPSVLITPLSGPAHECKTVRARYLSDAALSSADTAAWAITQELRHLERLSLEVICHAVYQPVSQLSTPHMDEAQLRACPDAQSLDAEQLYQTHIKGVYADLLDFMSRLEVVHCSPKQRAFWMNCQMLALQLVDAVKDAKHLQKNLRRFLCDEGSLTQSHYFELRHQLLWELRQLRDSAALIIPEAHWQSRLEWLDAQAAAYDHKFRERLFADVRAQRLNGYQASSLMNDLGYVSRIIQSLRNVVMLGRGGETLLDAVPAASPSSNGSRV